MRALLIAILLSSGSARTVSHLELELQTSPTLSKREATPGSNDPCLISACGFTCEAQQDDAFLKFGNCTQQKEALEQLHGNDPDSDYCQGKGDAAKIFFHIPAQTIEQVNARNALLNVNATCMPTSDVSSRD